MDHFVKKSIVDGIVCEIFFHSDDANDEKTKDRALAIIEDVVGPKENEQGLNLQTDRYRIVIKSTIQFCIIVGYLDGGALFRMAARFLHMTKELTSIASIGSACEGQITNFYLVCLRAKA